MANLNQCQFTKNYFHFTNNVGFHPHSTPSLQASLQANVSSVGSMDNLLKKFEL